MKKLLMVVPVLALAAGTTGCATKKFVRTEVGSVNDKVTTLASRTEENEQRIKANDAKITQVDQKYDQRVGQVDQKATAAGQSADQAAQAAKTVDGRVTEMANNSRKLVYGLVLNEASGGFKFAKSTLPDEAKAELDKMIATVAADPKAVFFEIEGHTDSTGAATTNEMIGLERAEAVKRYLYEQHHVPLHKISVISYGEEKPIAPNKTKAGRAQNRRVVIKVLT
jgi:peptidoglycan-associated lipoprotein